MVPVNDARPVTAGPHRHGRRALLLLAVLLLGLYGGRAELIRGVTPPQENTRWQVECDLVMLKKGLDATPRLRDTGRWWTGYWIGCNPFWRPLSSYLFWTQNRLLGWERFDRYLLVTVGWHLLVCVLLFLLVEAVTGTTALALLTVALVNVRIVLFERLILVPGCGLDTIGQWVYLPDVWLAACVLPALWCAWRGKVWGAIGLAALAAMTKETGFMVFPLVVIFYLWRFREWRWEFAAMIGLAGIMAATKLVGVGPGWILGSNRSIWQRIFIFVAGFPLNVLHSTHAAYALLGLGMAVSIIGWRNRWTRYGGVVCAVVVGTLTNHFLFSKYETPAGMAVALTALLEPSFVIGVALRCAVWVVLAYAGLRGPQRSLVALFIVGYLLIGFPATLAPQTGARSLYTAGLLFAAATALCVWSLPVVFRKREDNTHEKTARRLPGGLSVPTG